jgi:hypothetical protein
VRRSASCSTACSPRRPLLATTAWDTALVVAHGAVNRAILSYALTGERMFLGRFEQAPGCLNVLDVADRRVDRARGQHRAHATRPTRDATHADGAVLAEYGPGEPHQTPQAEGRDRPALSRRLERIRYVA